MSTSLNLKTYGAFARRYVGRFLRERAGELKTPVAPAPHKPVPREWRDERLTVAWLGHATVLINFYGTWILTDPALRARVGVQLGVTTIGPRRLVRPALSVCELPALDLLLVSHAHMDHCDLGTLKRLPRDVHTIVQRGNSDLVRRFRRVDELAWGETVAAGDVKITSVPTNHWGARKLTDTERGYGGFLLEKNGRTILFGGDTAYTNSFAQIARERAAQIDLAILPIGAYDPYISVHASPEQAWQMFRQMRAGFLMPIHHQTFQLSREPAREPVSRLLVAAGAERERIAVKEIGATWSLPE